jgi:hypothetical protein
MIDLIRNFIMDNEIITNFQTASLVTFVIMISPLLIAGGAGLYYSLKMKV